MRDSGITLDALEIKAVGTASITGEGQLRFVVAGTEQPFLLQSGSALAELKKDAAATDAKVTLVGKVQYRDLAAGELASLLVSRHRMGQP